MDYRMYSCNCAAGENIVSLIKESLKSQGITAHTPLKFIGFEATPGTMFKINKNKDAMAVPSVGKFISPFAGDRYMPIYHLEFLEGFQGNIYYII